MLKMYLYRIPGRSEIEGRRASWTPCATKERSPEPRACRPRTTPTCARSNCREDQLHLQLRPRMRAACRPSGRSATSPYHRKQHRGSNVVRSGKMTMTSVRTAISEQNPLRRHPRLRAASFSGLTKMNRSRETKNQISQIGSSGQRPAAGRRAGLLGWNDLLTARETMYAQELTVEQARGLTRLDLRHPLPCGGGYDPSSTAPSWRRRRRSSTIRRRFDYLTAKSRVRPHRRQGK